MSIRDYTEVYVAPCGAVLPNFWAGGEHETHCRECHEALRGDARTDDDD